ncbi:MAG TPA: MarR family transcriptional regulator [Chloroflexota bacterium]|nr:MarR family transcriptional regulator [Chloroflexota bacterium]
MSIGAKLGGVPARQPIRLGPQFERDYPGSSAVSTACVLNLVQTADRLSARVAALAHSSGIPSATAFVVLEILRGASEPLPPYVIAERLFLHRATVTGLLDSLETRGLVQRGPHPKDRRMVLITITPTARQLMDELVPRLHRAERAWLASLPAEQRRTLLELLVQLQAGLDASEDGEATTECTTID